MASAFSPRHPIDELAEEFVARYRKGERPSVSEYRQRYPDLADQLGEVLQALVLMEQLAPDPARVTGPVADDAPAPERLGEYRILREVGRGGMGVVYEAEQESLGRRVALKVLPAHARLTPTQLERFRREAKAVARLHHTNIVPVFGVGEQNGVHYYAMQFIVGQPLDAVVRDLQQLRDTGSDEAARVASTMSRCGLTVEEAGTEPFLRYHRGVARVGIQAAEALAYAHEQGVLHRDIKPSNLLLDERGTIWLTDFGLAKLLPHPNQAADAADLTATGDLVGTLRYLAPERLAGHADARSDVYSLGLTLYELLTLRPAFDETDRACLLRQLTQAEPPPPRSIDRRLPRDLETVVLRAIAKEPERRYPSAQHLADDLRRFLSDRPIQARRATWRERWWRWCRRNPALALVSCLAGLTLLLGLALTSWQWWRAERQRDRAESNEQQAQQQRKRAQAHRDRAVQTIDQMLTKVGAWEWQHLPHFAEQRRAVLEEALRLYQAMLDEDSDEPDLRHNTGQAHRRLGDILKLLGRHPEAEREYDRAIAVLGALTTETPEVPEYRRSLANAYNNRGSLYRELGRRQEARAAFLTVLELREQLARDSSADQEARLELAYTYRNLGILYKDLGDLTEAAAAFARGLALTEALTAVLPNNADASREVAQGWLALAGMHAEIGRSIEAEAAYERGRERLSRLARDHPSDVNYLDELARAHHKVGTFHLRRGRFAKAEEAYQQALRLQEQLAKDHPDVPERQHQLAQSHNNLGVLYHKVGRSDDAATAYREGLAVYARLVQAHPQVRDYHSGLTAGHTNLGTLFLDAGRLKEAEAAFRDNLAVKELLARSHPDVPDYQRSLADTHHNLGMVHQAAGRRAEALAAFQDALTLREQLACVYPTATTSRIDLAKSYSILGTWYRDSKHWDDAVAAYHRALAVREALTHDEPASTEHALDLGGTLCNVAHILSDRGAPQAALDWYVRALEIIGPVHQRTPNDATASRYLTNVHQGRAIAFNRLNRYAEAQRDWDRVIELCTGATRIRHRMQRGFTLARAGHHARAVAEAIELTAGTDVSPRTLYPAASICALSVTAARRDERLSEAERSEMAEAYAHQAMALLRRAIERGLTGAQHLQQDPDLEALRVRGDFQALMSELEAKERGKAKSP